MGKYDIFVRPLLFMTIKNGTISKVCVSDNISFSPVYISMFFLDIQHKINVCLIKKC